MRSPGRDSGVCPPDRVCSSSRLCGQDATADQGVSVPQVVVDRSLHLEGASNARDVGGYRTADGHTIRMGQVFRTNALDKLTPSDLAALQQRGVASVDDFRTVVERAMSPDRIPEGAGAIGST